MTQKGHKPLMANLTVVNLKFSTILFRFEPNIKYWRRTLKQKTINNNLPVKVIIYLVSVVDSKCSLSPVQWQSVRAPFHVCQPSHFHASKRNSKQQAKKSEEKDFLHLKSHPGVFNICARSFKVPRTFWRSPIQRMRVVASVWVFYNRALGCT